MTDPGGRRITFALVRWVGGPRIPEEAFLAAVAVEASRVVDALQALSRQAVAVPHRVGVDVVIALAQAAEPHGALSPQRVSEVAVVAQLAPLPWEWDNAMLGKRGPGHFWRCWLRGVCSQTTTGDRQSHVTSSWEATWRSAQCTSPGEQRTWRQSWHCAKPAEGPGTHPRFLIGKWHLVDPLHTNCCEDQQKSYAGSAV